MNRYIYLEGLYGYHVLTTAKGISKPVALNREMCTAGQQMYWDRSTEPVATAQIARLGLLVYEEVV